MADVAEVLSGKRQEKLIELYDELELNLLYDNEKEAVDVTASLRVNSACVRGGVEHANVDYLRSAGVHVLDDAAERLLLNQFEAQPGQLGNESVLEPYWRGRHLTRPRRTLPARGPEPGHFVLAPSDITERLVAPLLRGLDAATTYLPYKKTTS